MKTVAYWSTLMALARELGRARSHGSASDIEAAEVRLAAYERAVIGADELHLDSCRLRDLL